jgi:hypothetical protein
MNPTAASSGALMSPASAGMGGINQMLEIFKMQYLMRMFQDGGASGGASRGGILMFAVLMLYDQFVRYVPFLLNLLTSYAYQRLYPKQQLEPQLLMKSTPPPASKSIRAFIQFERNPEKSIADLRIDAVVHHVCTLPDVRSLRYNGVEMIPNFKDSIMIENDVWFEIQNPSNTAPSVFSGGQSGAAPKQEPIIYRLSTYDHDITWLHKFVEQAIDRFEQEKRNKLGSETYYFDQLPSQPNSYSGPGANGFCMFSKSKFLSNRTLDNVYLRQIGELKRRVHFFMRRRDWYDSKGIPHTLGVVMYGHPGCGKTSTIKAMANETHRHIFNIMLSSIKTKDALKDLFYNDTVHVIQDGKHELLNIPLKNRLYVIEDIDAMDSVVLKRSGEAQKEEQERKARMEAELELLKQQHGEMTARKMVDGRKDDDVNKLDLATLLNVLDGVRETPGRIIILSTNYPERLDEALLRPGRFDMMLEFEKHNTAVLQSHLEKHYDTVLSPEQLKKVHTSSLNFKWTPAEVSQILFRRIDDVDGALDDLLNEDPRKLFKFSQMGLADEASTVANINATVTATDNTNTASTLLDDLKQDAPADNQQSTNIEDLMQVNNASADTTAEAEKKKIDGNVVENVLVEQQPGDIVVRQDSAVKDTNNKQTAEELERIKKEIERMLQSPMFQDTTGFTAMNDLGIGNDDGFVSKTHTFLLPGLGAADSTAQTTLDDFFPEPLVAFDAATLGVQDVGI